jgi:hypothetical protein
MGSPYILKMLHRVPNKIIWISSFLKQSDLFRREEEGKKRGKIQTPRRRSIDDKSIAHSYY